MTAFPRRALWLLAVTVLYPTLCNAQTTEQSAKKSLDGYLGVGVISMPKYLGGTGNAAKPVPIAILEYEETVYVHFDRAGVRLWNSPDRKMALGITAQPRFGFHSEDGVRLNGMSTRHDSIEGGVAFEWELSQVSLSAAYFTDWSETTDGKSWRFSLDRQLVDSGPWDISAYLDLDYANARIVQYYFGVQADESTATRPAYQPGGALISSLGLSGAYKLSKDYALLFGGEISYLGTAAADSPIVQRRNGLMGYLGLGLVF